MTPETIAGLFHDLIEMGRNHVHKRAIVIGVGGAQGCGKSFQCRSFAEISEGRVAHLSLDDFYYTRAQRVHLAETRHPLLMTRGPPGTHNIQLAKGAIARLNNAKSGEEVHLPQFDKARDERAPAHTWRGVQGKPVAILFEGWCIGATCGSSEPTDESVEAFFVSQEAAYKNTCASYPLNALEAEEDPKGHWRGIVVSSLLVKYAMFHANWFDTFVYFQAPSWDIVRRWRGEQEEEMLGRALTMEENIALDRFVMHFERVTRSMMAGNHRAHFVVHLNKERRVVRIERQFT